MCNVTSGLVLYHLSTYLLILCHNTTLANCIIRLCVVVNYVYQRILQYNQFKSQQLITIYWAYLNYEQKSTSGLKSKQEISSQLIK